MDPVFKPGAKVKLLYTYPKIGDVIIDATLIGTPMGEGDMWRFEGIDGTAFCINPYHYGLVSIDIVK